MANSIKIGGFSFDVLKIGSSDVDAAYLGDTLVYGGTPPTPTFDGKWLATYTGGTTSSAVCDASSAITENEISELTDVVSVEIGDCVTTIGEYAFGECYSLTSVTIGSGVTSIGDWAFNGCSNLTSIDIPDSVTSIGEDAIQSCSSLTSIDIPSGVTSIGDLAFEGCESLTSITVNATTPPTLGNAAFNNTNDCPIYVPDEDLHTYQSAEYWSDYASRIQPIPNS